MISRLRIRQMSDYSQIKRRQFLQTVGVGAASALLSSNSARANPSPRGSNRNKPNVLLIMTDQHRADLMTCARRDLVPTPNVDRIASRGVRFNNAYCPYPVCVASRMALLTGLYSHSTGAISNRDNLDWRYRTMANHFAENGYLTGLIGKMNFVDAHNHGFEYSIYNHGATHELYDHQADPGEFVNRINDPALRKIRNRLRDRLFAWYNPEKNPYRPDEK